MPLTKGDYESMLKIDYHGPMVDQLENSLFFLSKIERYVEPTGGRHLYMPTRIGRTTSIGARNDGSSENLPTGDRPNYASVTFPVKSLYATIRISGFAMRSSKPTALAFERALTSDMELTVKDMKKDLNRQLFLDGSGELCRIVGSGTTTTVTCINNWYPTNPTKFLYAREKIDIRTVTDGVIVTNGDGITINAVPTTTTFNYTTTGFTKTTNTQAVYRYGNVGNNAAGSAVEVKEIYGLAAALYNVDPDVAQPSNYSSGYVDFGTRATIANFGGLDRGTAGNEYWKGNLLNNSTVGLRSFSVNLVEQGIDQAEIIGGGVIDIIQTNHAIYRIYGSMLAAAKQYDGAQMKLDGGWKALDLNGIPMFKDVECPDYHIFLIDSTTLMLGVVGDWAWLEDGDTGGILSRLPGQDQYEGVFNRDCNLMCDQPNKNCVIADVAHS